MNKLNKAALQPSVSGEDYCRSFLLQLGFDV